MTDEERAALREKAAEKRAAAAKRAEEEAEAAKKPTLHNFLNDTAEMDAWMDQKDEEGLTPMEREEIEFRQKLVLGVIMGLTLVLLIWIVTWLRI